MDSGQAPALSVPSGTKPPSQDPEQLVPGLELGTRTRAEGHRQLVMEEQVLDKEVLLITGQIGKRADEEPQHLKHSPRILDRSPAEVRFCRPTTSISK